MKTTKEPSVLPYAICFALTVLAVVFPAIFFRELTAWAILFALAPFALVEIFGLWLVLDGFTKAKGGPN
jgi:hypothetical protein